MRKYISSIILLNIIILFLGQTVNASELKNENYIYKINRDNTITLLRYIGRKTKEIKIPDSINGRKVKKIGYKIFKENKGISYISLPRTGYIFEKGCFVSYYFSGRERSDLYFKIRFKNKVASAYLNPSSDLLYTTELYEKYEKYDKQDVYITSQGFIRTKDKILYCFDTDGRTIKIPDGIRSIIGGAFDVEMLSLSDEAEEFFEDGDLISYYNNNLKYKMKKIIMSNELEYIGGGGNFEECPNLRHFKCMDNVEHSDFHRNYFFKPHKKINEAFVNNKGTLVFALRGSKYNARKNNEYIISDNIKEIEEDAFKGYIFREKILRFNNKIMYIPKLGKMRQNNISEVILPENLKIISSKAFMSFTNLKKIIIPPTVERIGTDALGYKRSGKKIDDFEIYGEVGSVAEKYAKDNGFAFYDVKTNKLQIYDEKNVRNRDGVWVIVWIFIAVIISLIVGVVLYINIRKRKSKL